MTTKEAERLAFWGLQQDLDEEAKDDFGLALREALAAERRATVERIRERLDEVDWMKPRTLRAILDEEAAR